MFMVSCRPRKRLISVPQDVVDDGLHAGLHLAGVLQMARRLRSLRRCAQFAGG
jgi:hypothetical protein